MSKCCCCCQQCRSSVIGVKVAAADFVRAICYGGGLWFFAWSRPPIHCHCCANQFCPTLWSKQDQRINAFQCCSIEEVASTAAMRATKKHAAKMMSWVDSNPTAGSCSIPHQCQFSPNASSIQQHKRSSIAQLYAAHVLTAMYCSSVLSALPCVPELQTTYVCTYYVASAWTLPPVHATCRPLSLVYLYVQKLARRMRMSITLNVKHFTNVRLT